MHRLKSTWKLTNAIRGVLVASVVTNPYAMDPIGRIRLLPHWYSRSRKKKKLGCVPVSKPEIRRIVTGLIIHCKKCPKDFENLWDIFQLDKLRYQICKALFSVAASAASFTASA